MHLSCREADLTKQERFSCSIFFKVFTEEVEGRKYHTAALSTTPLSWKTTGRYLFKFPLVCTAAYPISIHTGRANVFCQHPASTMLLVMCNLCGHLPFCVCAAIACCVCQTKTKRNVKRTDASSAWAVRPRGRRLDRGRSPAGLPLRCQLQVFPAK